MISIKSPQEIKILHKAGRILEKSLDIAIKNIKPGVRISNLDKLIEDYIVQADCEPSFKNYKERSGEPEFPTTICASVNNEVVHSPASERVLKAGDIVGIDTGLRYLVSGKYYYVDMAKTVPVGKVSQLARRLIKVTKRALDLAIEQVRPGNYVADISRAVQIYVEKQGFSVVRQLVGHGVGYKVHEAPRIPNFIDPEAEEIKLAQGMVLAIEPMVNVGDWRVKTLADGWTIVTVDSSLSAHFEHTVAVTKGGHEILTK